MTISLSLSKLGMINSFIQLISMKLQEFTYFFYCPLTLIGIDLGIWTSFCKSLHDFLCMDFHNFKFTASEFSQYLCSAETMIVIFITGTVHFHFSCLEN